MPTGGRRKRRVVPHQTEIDKFFRRLTERDIKNLPGGMLDALNLFIFRKIAPRRTWKIAADNTRFPYYGKPDSSVHIKIPLSPWNEACTVHTGAVGNRHGNPPFYGIYRAEEGRANTGRVM